MGVVVETRYGKLEGVQESGLQIFKGIPFARPPVGSLRFCAPQPPEGWDGVRPAGEFGPSSIQGVSPLPGMSAEGPRDEDCLYLNVFTPSADAGKRPVMFWVHGGGFTMGASNSPLYDGSHLAVRGDVVVVSINYRLGALGYLYLGGLGGNEFGAAANCGQLDQIAGLEWTRDNIAEFGGDPDNVTIFGESAGSMAVTALMGMPKAAGLFKRVIAESGAANNIQDTSEALRNAKNFLEELKVNPDDLQKIQEVSADDILNAQLKIMARRASLVERMAFGPVIDGDSIPESPLEQVRKGGSKDVGLIIGSNRDEAKLFKNHKDVRPIPDDELEKMVGKLILPGSDAKADELIRVYKQSREAHGLSSDNVDIYDAMVGDRTFRIPGTVLAEAHGNAYSYLFTWESPAMRGALGACHALEIPFVFGNIGQPDQLRFAGTGPEAERLSEIMMDAWLAFAKTGNPNTEDFSGWNIYESEKRASMIFSADSGAEDLPFEEERAVWKP